MRHSTHRYIAVLLYAVIVTPMAVYGFHISKDLDWLGQYMYLLSQAVALCFGMTTSVWASVLPDYLEPCTSGEKYNPSHRAYTHSLVITGSVIVFISFLLCLLLWRVSLYITWLVLTVYIAGVVGYLSHIVGDLFTDNGVCLWWPINKRRVIPEKYRLWRYRDTLVQDKVDRILKTIILIIFAASALYFVGRILRAIFF